MSLFSFARRFVKTTALIYGLLALAGLASPSPLRAQLIVATECLPSGGACAFDAAVALKDPAFAETTALASARAPKSALPPSPPRSESSSLGTDAWTSRNTPTSIARTTVPVVPPLTDAFSLSQDMGAETSALSGLFNQLTSSGTTSESSVMSTYSTSSAPRERRDER